MSTYQVTTEDGSIYEIDTEDTPQSKYDELKPSILGTAGKLTRGLFQPAVVASEMGRKAAGENVGTDQLDEFIGNQSLGFGNESAFGLPRFLANKATGVDIGQGGAAGRLAGVIAGPGNLGHAAAKSIPFLQAGKGVGRLANAGLRGGIEGLIAGGTTSTGNLEDFVDSDTRIANSLFGAAGGVVGGALAQGVGDKLASNAIKKQLSSKQAVLDALDQIEATGSTTTEVAKRTKLEQLALQNKDLAETLSLVKAGKKTTIEALKEAAEVSNKKLLTNLAQMADDEAGTISSEWQKAYGANKSSINSRMDAILEKAGGVEFSDIQKVRNSVIDELKSQGVNLDKDAIIAIDKAISKYNPRKFLTAKGVEQTRISAKELRNLRADVNAEIRAAAFQKGGASVDDLGDVVFSKKLGELLDTKAPGYSDLNSELGELYKVKKFAGKRFDDSIAGSEYLQKMASRGSKSEIAHYNDFLKFMEKGGVKVNSGVVGSAENVVANRLTNKANIARATQELDKQIGYLQSNLKYGRANLKAGKYGVDQEIKVLEGLKNNLNYLDRYGREGMDIAFKGGAGFALFKLLNRVF